MLPSMYLQAIEIEEVTFAFCEDNYLGGNAIVSGCRTAAEESKSPALSTVHPYPLLPPYSASTPYARLSGQQPTDNTACSYKVHNLS